MMGFKVQRHGEKLEEEGRFSVQWWDLKVTQNTVIRRIKYVLVSNDGI